MADFEKRSQAFCQLLHDYERIAIIGGPRTGKTSLSLSVVNRPVVHTDDYMHFAWADAPQAINEECRRHESFVLEGVQAARCLRGGKDGNRAPLEVDAVLWLDNTLCPVSPQQAAMAKGIKTTFADWLSRNPRVVVRYPDK